MRNLIIMVGVLLIFLGIFGFGYKYYPYKTDQNVAVLGPLEIATEHNKYIYFPPLLSGLSITAGVIIIILSKRK